MNEFELAYKETMLIDALGDSQLLVEILNALDTDTENDILDYIARMYDIDFEKYNPNWD